MNRTGLIFRNIWFHRKPYLALLAGIAVSTAVLTGALIVGDSVRFSLQRVTDIRLGKIRYALQTSDRFFRQELAVELSAQTHLPVVPVLQAGGMAINSDKNLRINQVQIIGMDGGFSKLWDDPLPAPGTDEAIISRNVAEQLKLQTGDDLLLRIQKKGKSPSNAPFVAEKTPSVSIRVKISSISGDSQMGRFSLKSNQTPPYNIFLSLKQMAGLLELTGSANMLLVKDTGDQGLHESTLESALRVCLKPADAGLAIRKLTASGLYQVSSDRIFFDDSTAYAITSTIPGCQTILTYLVNSISSGSRSTPYSFVTAANDPFLKQAVGPGQIIINDWLAKDLGVQTGDSVRMRYFLMGPLRSLREDSNRFMVKSVIPLHKSQSEEELMPDFPGMSGAGNCRDWETGAPIDLKKIRDKDEQYWKDYRGTPKAYISMAAGQKIWGNMFGSHTAFRFNAWETDIPGIEKSLMLKIKPAQSGMVFRPVYAEGQYAARNSTDFGELFLSLSFFILLSALLLTGMLFYLLARMRLAETGILSALGFGKRLILEILSAEALLVTLAGAVIGTAAGILYNYLLILGLNTLWQGAVNTRLLVMKINPMTLLTGSALGAVISLAVLLFVLWNNMRKPLSVLVKGSDAIPAARNGKTKRALNILMALFCFGVSATLLVWLLVHGKTRDGSLFLVTGGLILPGGYALLSLILRPGDNIPGLTGIPGLPQIILKNISLHRNRTLTAVALLSLGTFTIIITGANRKTAYGIETTRNSGTGGFLLWAETAIPIMNDLNSSRGAAIFGLNDEKVLQSVRYIQFLQVEGDDASCLNLNQVSQPGLLGVQPVLFDREKAFTFASLDPSVDQNHPWKALSLSLAPGMIPGFADQTVISWGLRKAIGDTLLYRDESGRILKIKLVGGLDNSIFQGSILVSDSLLRRFYPSAGGSRTMLIDGPANESDAIAGKLESLFRDYGLMVTPASERLASFNVVENTYLSVFMMLGGFGVIIGTIGFGIVLLRNIAQRKQELALYSALGFQKQFVFKLILSEHLLMLATGLLLGLIAAFPVILPALISPGNTVPWLFISGILLLILANGFLWIYFPLKKILKRNPLPGLRTE